jgi:uncharacterized protein YigE (DUF2233 family)
MTKLNLIRNYFASLNKKSKFVKVLTVLFVLGVIAILHLFLRLSKPYILARLGNANIVSIYSFAKDDHLSGQLITIKRDYCPFSFDLYIFEFDPEYYSISIEDKRGKSPKETTQDTSTVLKMNAGYFNDSQMPTLMLKDNSNVYKKKINVFSGFFWYDNGNSDIVHISKYRKTKNKDVVIQSTPRLIDNGVATVGVKDIKTIDSRSGIGITKSGKMIFYATDNNLVSGLSQREVRRIFIDRYNTKHLMSLDGGSSVQFVFKHTEVYKHVKGYRRVPFGIVVKKINR